MSHSRCRRPAQTVVEFAVALPVLVLVLLGVIQFGLWYHAQNVVLAASREGAHVAAREGASPEEGIVAARRLLVAGLGREAAQVQVAVDGDAAVAVLVAQGALAPIVPLSGVAEGLPLRARAVAYREGFRP